MSKFVSAIVILFVLVLLARGCSESSPTQRHSYYPTSTANSTTSTPSNSAPSNPVPSPSVRQLEMSSIRFTEIPTGRFQMGSPESEPAHQPNEAQREIGMPESFFLSVTEITEDQYAALSPLALPRPPRPGVPVTAVTWDESRYFCWALQAANPTMRFRLPNEAEWEYACRADFDGPFPPWPGHESQFREGLPKFLAGDTGFLLRKLSRVAWYGQNGPAHVASLEPNAWGLHDMLGNVWEWCEDFDAPPSADLHPIRGGAWSSTDPMTLRAASRAWARRELRKDSIGFRVLCRPR